MAATTGHGHQVVHAHAHTPPPPWGFLWEMLFQLSQVTRNTTSLTLEVCV